VSLVAETCRVILSSGSVDFSGTKDGTRCGQPFFGYVHEDVPACREHVSLYEKFFASLFDPMNQKSLYHWTDSK